MLICDIDRTNMYVPRSSLSLRSLLPCSGNAHVIPAFNENFVRFDSFSKCWAYLLLGSYEQQQMDTRAQYILRGILLVLPRSTLAALD